MRLVRNGRTIATGRPNDPRIRDYQVEDRENILIATINRPKALNALNAQVLSDLEALIDGVSTRSDLRVLVLTGAGKAFVAGADIAAMADMQPDQTKFLELGHRVFQSLKS